MNEPVGRDAQRTVIEAFVAATRTGAAELTIDGEAGIGKTTLCRHAESLSTAAGLAVLTCRPTQAESLLSFAALTDLLAAVSDDAFDSLPTPQRHALAVATLREEPSAGASPDMRAVGTALATLLTALSAQHPSMLLVDDEQWLDPASYDVLAFALRRVAVPLGLLVSHRSDAAVGSSLTDAMSTPIWRERLTLRGLTAAALFHIVREQLGLTLARPTLVRIAEMSGGNPFVAVELARATAAAAASGSPASAVPIPRSLQSLSIDRLTGLSEGAKLALLALACAPRPTTTLIEALGLAGHLAEAEASGAIDIRNDRITFSHPLLATAALELFTTTDHRAMHARLGALTDDPEAIARHRAFAVPEPDDEVARSLDAAAETASRRGATNAALELARFAIERTVDPEGPAAWERRVRLAELLHAAGDTSEAAIVLAGLEHRCAAGPIKARGRLILTEVAWQNGTTTEALHHATAACAEAGTDISVLVRAKLSLATITRGDTALANVAEARRLIEGAADVDNELTAWVLCADINCRMQAGGPLDRASLELAIRLERTDRDWTSGDQAIALAPAFLKWADLHDEALAVLDELALKAAEEGNEGVLPYVSGHAFGALWRLGRFEDAVEEATKHLAQAEATGQAGQRIQALYNFAWIHAYAGRFAEASSAADDVLEYATHTDDEWMAMGALWVLGLIALSEDDAPRATALFDRWAVVRDHAGVLHPGISRGHGDHIEALVGTGSIERAAALTDELDSIATRAELLSTHAIARRCRALVSAAHGEVEVALRQIDEALQLHDQCVAPFERARALLVKGAIHRRLKQKRAAMDALDEAAASFTAVGATAWARRAADEAGRVGRRPSAALDLTDTERRIAVLAAGGLTNRQVAERAFISAKTVEANLAKVYRKLGISSRAELGARMAALAADD